MLLKLFVFFKNSVKDISLYLIIQPAIVFFLSQFYNDENRLLYYLRLCSSMSLSISPNSCERVQFSNVRSVIWDVHVAQLSKRRIKVQGCTHMTLCYLRSAIWVYVAQLLECFKAGFHLVLGKRTSGQEVQRTGKFPLC